MCHVEVGIFADGETGIETLEHGPRWHAAMIRLHDQGEAWVLKDLANAEQSETEKETLLVQILLAMDGLDRALPFHAARAAVWPEAKSAVRAFCSRHHSTRRACRRVLSRLGGCFK